jgi:hypothetical protein
MWPRQSRDGTNVTIDLPRGATAAQVDLVTRIRALQERLILRPSWNGVEIRTFLKGAGECAVACGDVAAGQKLLERAEGLFLQSLRTVNRNWYVAAMLVGVVLVGLVGFFVWHLAAEGTTPLAEQPTIIALFSFASMGSLTSVFIRLTSLDLKLELSRKFIIYLAIAKPFVAISFASVVYVILKNNLVSFGRWDASQQEAIRWVAAFLCGFSERFASDVLEKIAPLAAKGDGGRST